MTIRNREDTFAFSDDLSLYSLCLASSPALEVEAWRQQIALPTEPSYCPLTPPDTDSDCAPSDILDMDCIPWPQGNLPDDSWSQTQPKDTVTSVLPVNADWPEAMFRSAGPSFSNDLAYWTTQSRGPVEEGMSPAQSYVSQSGRTLNTISETDTFPQVSTGSPYLPVIPGDFYEDATPTYGYQGDAHHSLANGPPYGNNIAQDVTFVDLSRLPARSRGGSLPGRTSNRVSTHMPGHMRAQAPVHQVAMVNNTVLPVRTHTDMSGQLYKRSQASSNGMAYEPAYAYMDRSTSLPGRNAPVILDPVADDFAALIDMSGQIPLVDHGISFNKVSQDQYTGHIAPTYAVEQPLPDREIKVHLNRRISASTTAGVSSEADEGRHNRTDPLYNREPGSDGLYHCPYEGEDSCNHAPNKLKCNYDKFIDSHLKPFRCKIDACSKQVFSSTACLLRHEREAHGMHGHGKCPYLCEYTGCERSDPDKGFPRLYNLRDHMKRVHAWKEPSNEEAVIALPRRSTGRKRKSSASAKATGPSQRQRTTDSFTSAATMPEFVSTDNTFDDCFNEVLQDSFVDWSHGYGLPGSSQTEAMFALEQYRR